MNRIPASFPVKIILVAIVLFLNASDSTQAQEKGYHTPFNLSLIYPISINRTPYDKVDINIGLIGSRFGTLEGFSVNTVYSLLEKNLYGFQLNGLYAETRGKLLGFQVTGGLNSLKGNGIGAMLALIGNLSYSNFKGFQVAGLGNINFETFSGLQVSGALNVTGTDVNTLQFTGLGNIAGNDLKGAQISAIFNILGGHNRGLQLSYLNIARDVNGMQLGIFNVARNNSGLQLGLFNFVTKKQDGTTLGLFYKYEKTKVSLIASGGNFAYFAAGVRFKNSNVYTMLNLGSPIAHSNTNKSIMAEYRAGYSYPTKIFDINADVGYAHFINEIDQVQGKSSRNQFALTFRAGIERRINKTLALSINTGYTTIADSYTDPQFEGKFLIEGGIVLF